MMKRKPELSIMVSCQ